MYQKFFELLQQKNLRAADVSKGTGISSGFFSDWKKGKYEPKLDKLQKIADFLEVPISYFTDEDISVVATKTKKIPKDLRKILEEEEIALNGRLLSPDDKERMYRIISAAFYDAKEMNRRKK